MKKILIIQGIIETVNKMKTKAGKDYTVYQVASETKQGFKIIEKIKDWQNRGLKVGDKVQALAFEEAQIWKEKIIKNYSMAPVEMEKDVFAALGLYKQDKIKI